MITPVESIVSLLQTQLEARNSDIVARRNSVISDAYLLPAAAALSWNSAIMEFTRSVSALDTILLAKTDTVLQASVAEVLGLSIDGVLQLLTAAIDRAGTDMGLTRKAAQSATGLVFFYVNSAPSADLYVPAGTQVETAQGVVFSTSTEIVLLKDLVSGFYDPAINAYAVSTPVTAAVAGSTGNVPAESVIYPVASLPAGFAGLINKYDITNGYEAETDEEYVARIKLTRRGSNLETKDGMAALILNNTTVRNVFIADAQSPYQLRNSGKGGVVDIYTTDSIPAAVADVQAYASSELVLEHQPVLEITSVRLSDNSITYTEGTDYILVKDTNVLSRNSARAQDMIRWITSTGIHPGVGVSYTVDYVYNQAVEHIQTLLTTDNYRPLMGDVSTAVLAREGIQVPVEVSFQVVIYGSYSATTVRNEAITNVQAYINALGFGANLAQSDVINVIENTPGVNYVNTTPLAFNRVGSAIEQNITALDYEYIRVSSVEIL